MPTDIPENKAVIFFDGVCNLCNASVQFIIKRDNKDYFRFAQLQSALAARHLPQHAISSMASVLLLENGKVYQKSTAALKIARNLRGGWFFLYPFIFINQRLRDVIYDWIANNRYKWFGKRMQCMIPDQDLAYKFLDA